MQGVPVEGVQSKVGVLHPHAYYAYIVCFHQMHGMHLMTAAAHWKEGNSSHDSLGMMPQLDCRTRDRPASKMNCTVCCRCSTHARRLQHLDGDVKLASIAKKQ